MDTPGHKKIAETTHVMFDGRLQVYLRPGGHVFQCAARVGGKRFRSTTNETVLSRAKDVAEEWYLDLRGKLRNGVIVPDKSPEKTFADAWEGYLKHVRVLAIGTRSSKYVSGLELRVKRHLLPFFGPMALSSINRGVVQTYRVKRIEETIAATAVAGVGGAPDKPGRPPARSTQLHEMVHLRQIMKWAEGMGWIPFVPSFTQDYLSQTKKGRRAWFSPEEYAKLHKATKKRELEGKRRGFEHRYADLHDMVILLANTGLRPDEKDRLELRDVKIEYDPASRDDILVIDVRGKVGTGYCMSLPGAVYPFKRLVARRQLELELLAAEKDELKGLRHGALLKARRKIEADLATGLREPTQVLPETTRLFPRYDRDTFNEILKEEGLKRDRDGQVRTAYSLRHTYISMRLMAGAKPVQVANNCRTSIQMIEDHYASHIKNFIDTSQVNVTAKKPPAPRRKKVQAEQSQGVSATL